jgi:hypothetical protein
VVESVVDDSSVVALVDGAVVVAVSSSVDDDAAGDAAPARPGVPTATAVAPPAARPRPTPRAARKRGFMVAVLLSSTRSIHRVTEAGVGASWELHVSALARGHASIEGVRGFP